MKCTNCGQELGDGAKFCPGCGTAAKGDEILKCVIVPDGADEPCGTVLDAAQAFCPGCGGQMAKALGDEGKLMAKSLALLDDFASTTAALGTEVDWLKPDPLPSIGEGGMIAKAAGTVDDGGDEVLDAGPYLDALLHGNNGLVAGQKTLAAEARAVRTDQGRLAKALHTGLAAISKQVAEQAKHIEEQSAMLKALSETPIGRRALATIIPRQTPGEKDAGGKPGEPRLNSPEIMAKCRVAVDKELLDHTAVAQCEHWGNRGYTLKALMDPMAGHPQLGQALVRAFTQLEAGGGGSQAAA